MSWLDVKLGIRMLSRYPWLSGVSVVGMALAIALGAGYFSIVGLALDGRLPVPGGDRLVTIQTRTIPDGRTGGVLPAHFAEWRDDVSSVTAIGAFRNETRNLTTADGRTDVVRVAAMSSSGFPLVRATPLLGRSLLEADERPGAAPVVVIGHDAWRRHFDADSRAVGAMLRLDGQLHTIVGVMPEGFLFPVRHHYWVPLALTNAAPASGQELIVFGRVAEGVTLQEARAELRAIGERMGRAFPGTHANLGLYASRYTHTFIGIDEANAQGALRSFQLGAGLLLFVVAVNVAILVYARTATRTGEIVVRTALGASRGRVVLQLFAEALVLTASAAVLGLSIVAVFFRLLNEWVKQAPHLDAIPYWFQPALSFWTILYMASSSVIAAVVIGALPALKATGRAVHGRLQQFPERGAGLQLGRIWTALIVVQVAIAVAVLPAALHNAREALALATRAPSPMANTLLRGTLVAPEPHAARVPSLAERLESDPEIAAVTAARDFPGREKYALVDVEGTGHAFAASTLIAPNLLDVFGVTVLAGRGLTAADALSGANTVVVDQAFADTLSPDTTVVGRRFRYVNNRRDGAVEFGPWLEVVGVVPTFSTSFTAPPPFTPQPPRFYHAASSDDPEMTTLVVKLRSSDPRQAVTKVRTLVASADPTLKLQNLTSVVDAWNYDSRASSIAAGIILAVTGSVLLLSAAGIYSMMSFTVASRRREIGIRAALGADARQVLAGIFGRACAQLGAGVTVGLAVAAALDTMSGGSMLDGNGRVLLPGVTGLMLATGLLAALGPARRGLAVQPTEALRGE
jgi:putative ABC transport system permease protein